MLRCTDIKPEQLSLLLRPYGLTVEYVAENEHIPGSYWQAPEAGLISNTLYVRPDTPVHSALHEACHYICMDENQRQRLNTDAGGGFDEENAVCYLQIVLAEQLESMGKETMFMDMDTWGYSFRLGSSRAWFNDDAEDARAWLQAHGVISQTGQATGKIRIY